MIPKQAAERAGWGDRTAEKRAVIKKGKNVRGGYQPANLISALSNVLEMSSLRPVIEFVLQSLFADKERNERNNNNNNNRDSFN